MRISKFIIEENELRIEPIKMIERSLGSTVVLIGKNGAGKTRILQLIESFYKDYTRSNFLNEFITCIPSNIFDQRKFKEVKQSILDPELIKNINSNANYEIEVFYQNFKNIQSRYFISLNTNLLKNIDNHENTANKSIAKLIDDETLKNIINNKINKEEIKEINNKNYSNINTLFSQTAIKFIESICNDILLKEFNYYISNKESNVENNKNIINALENEFSIKYFNIIKKYVKLFLKKELGYKAKKKGDTPNNTIVSQLLLNSIPFDIKDLSPGQKVLFSYSILFSSFEWNLNIDLKDSIIIIDEPETHLHPEAQVQLIKSIKELVKDSGQLWIATHSIHVLSVLDYDEIFLVKDGRFHPPSNQNLPIILEELMGLEENVDNLQHLISSISQWEFANFITQCFTNPEVISNANKNDPQIALFLNFIQEYKKNTLYFLDYGAGTGRFLKELADAKGLSTIIYNALEKNTSYHKNLLSLIDENRIYTNSNDINDNQFDIILLCNVLHEIPFSDWNNEFQEIKRILKPSGYLLIIEDLSMPKGEWIETGYLILSNKELKKLFRNESIYELTLDDERYRDRIVMNIIKYDIINQIDVLASLEELIKNTFSKLKHIKDQGQLKSNGRKWANLTQLYINGSLAVDIIKSSKSTSRKKN